MAIRTIQGSTGSADRAARIVMANGRSRIFWVLVLCVQMIAAAACARGQVLCRDAATGQTQRETVAEQWLCDRCQAEPVGATDLGTGTTLEEAGCVDMPIAGLDALAKPRGPLFDAFAATAGTFALLPTFVIPDAPMTARARGDEAAVPLNDTRHALRTVVLVI